MQAPNRDDLRIKIFGDGADLDSMRELYALPHIAGFTTNPTLMRKAGISDYRDFARAALAAIPDRPISFEVFADDFPTMERQALEIASWGPNVYVKIPISNTAGESAAPLVGRLSHQGIKVNVTAMFTLDQVDAILQRIDPATPAVLSVFAGRIADTGRDPVPLMRSALERTARFPKVELLWASPRELLNIFQADEIGCHIITVTGDLLAKLSNVGKDLEQFSIETVAMFYKDAAAAGYRIDPIDAQGGNAAAAG